MKNEPHLVKSPCIRNCCLDPKDVCIGCGRALIEITGWHSMDDAAKQEVLKISRERLLQFGY